MLRLFYCGPTEVGYLARMRSTRRVRRSSLPVIMSSIEISSVEIRGERKSKTVGESREQRDCQHLFRRAKEVEGKNKPEKIVSR
jgi:hypothetical protein